MRYDPKRHEHDVERSAQRRSSSYALTRPRASRRRARNTNKRIRLSPQARTTYWPSHDGACGRALARRTFHLSPLRVAPRRALAGPRGAARWSLPSRSSRRAPLGESADRPTARRRGGPTSAPHTTTRRSRRLLSLRASPLPPLLLLTQQQRTHRTTTTTTTTHTHTQGAQQRSRLCSSSISQAAA